MELGGRVPFFLLLLPTLLSAGAGCGGEGPEPAEELPPSHPQCSKPPRDRADSHSPRSVVADFAQPVRMGPTVNTLCPEDAIEISRDGMYLYFLFTKDLLVELSPEEILARPNGTYRARRTGGPGEFELPVFYDLGKGTAGSLDGELSVSPDGRNVYFHSLRATNTGYRNDPPTDDFLDIYVADLIDGEPGPGRNLGPPVNSIYPDGEAAIHPDGASLYFASTRPGGLGKNDIWSSVRDSSVWRDPINLGPPINSGENDTQPAFTSDGMTIYFVSDRDPAIGSAIYRSTRSGDSWGDPEPVITGIVGEPSVTADGRLLYFVHVLTDSAGIFDADIWYAAKTP